MGGAVFWVAKGGFWGWVCVRIVKARFSASATGRKTVSAQGRGWRGETFGGFPPVAKGGKPVVEPIAVEAIRR